jgi:hypothetical protein
VLRITERIPLRTIKMSRAQHASPPSLAVCPLLLVLAVSIALVALAGCKKNDTYSQAHANQIRFDCTQTVGCQAANGTTLDSTAVSSAVSALQTSLNSAITGLGLPSTYDPTGTVDAALASLQTALTAISAPTANNSASAHAFLRSISTTIGSSLSSVNKAVSTSVQNYNNSLL